MSPRKNMFVALFVAMLLGVLSRKQMPASSEKGAVREPRADASPDKLGGEKLPNLVVGDSIISNGWNVIVRHSADRVELVYFAGMVALFALTTGAWGSYRKASPALTSLMDLLTC
eukprot:TRINITY_DN49707_c0_g1_i1.p1 TRINITY_DN49707_c0_g1~~TRINITY_DN49707_c0_g1_i1.p1  ORF type:complete len:115 (-),score=20.95 TRINITY_DN49707_c0_g1_i1:175-519(-)